MAIGPWQILVVVVLLLLLFGAGRLAEIGRGLGEGIRNFKKGLAGDSSRSEVDEGEAGLQPLLPLHGESTSTREPRENASSEEQHEDTSSEQQGASEQDQSKTP